MESSAPFHRFCGSLIGSFLEIITAIWVILRLIPEKSNNHLLRCLPNTPYKQTRLSLVRRVEMEQSAQLLLTGAGE